MARIRNSIIVSVVTVLLFSCMVFAIYIWGRASVIGSGIGEINGKIVGTAIGSVRGITIGIREGAEAGANAGLSADDTTADIKGTMDSIGKLEVLEAGVTLKNINKIGDSYKGLYLISGDAVFTVDLNTAEISYSQDGKDVYILIPAPELELYLDQNSTEKLAETQNFSLTVSAKDGLVAYLNSMTQIVENVKDSMANYDSLMSTAKESAKNQIEQFTATICDDSQSVHVEFK